MSYESKPPRQIRNTYGPGGRGQNGRVSDASPAGTPDLHADVLERLGTDLVAGRLADVSDLRALSELRTAVEPVAAAAVER